jgi:hypothetical protein
MSRESKQVEAGTLPTVAPEAGARLRSRAGLWPPVVRFSLEDARLAGDAWGFNWELYT